MTFDPCEVEMDEDDAVMLLGESVYDRLKTSQEPVQGQFRFVALEDGVVTLRWEPSA